MITNGGGLGLDSTTASPVASSRVEAAVVLGACVSLVSFITAISIVGLLIERSETLEALMWILSVGCAVPLGVATSMLLIRRYPGHLNTSVIAPTVAGLGFGVLAAKFLSEELPVPGAVILVFVPLSAVGVVWRQTFVGWANAGASRPLVQGLLGGAGVMCITLAFVPSGALSLVSVGLGSLVTMTGVVAVNTFTTRLTPSTRDVKRLLRFVVATVLSLATGFMVWGLRPRANWYDQNFFLGPAFEIKHGRFMLVDVFAQYGVGSIYAVSGALSILGFGYGSFLLLVGFLTFLTSVVVFVTLRVATGSTGWAVAGALTAAVAGPIATLDYSEWYPSTGFLRFGPTWLMVLALVLAFRTSEVRKPWFGLALGFLGISCIWSFESAFYSLGTFVLTILALCAIGRDLRKFVKFFVSGIASILLAVLIIALWTRLASGSFPDLGGYLDFIRLYSSQGFGTLPVDDWSLGYLIGAAYVVSFIAIGTVAIGFPSMANASPRVMVPLVATTSYGFLSFTYFLGRSHPNNLTHISPPFIVMTTLWTWLAAIEWSRNRKPVFLGFVAAVLFGASLLVIGQWGKISTKFPDSALAAVLSPLTGSPSLADRISELQSNPVVADRVRTIESLVRRNVPADQPLLLLAEPSLLTESLLRLDRTNTIPLSVPSQDGLLPVQRDRLIGEASSLPCGTWVVTQNSMVRSRAKYVEPALLSSIYTAVSSNFNLVQVASDGDFRVLRAECRR